MRIFNDLGRGLLAVTTLAALQVASPVYAQYSPYPQTQPAYQPAPQQQAYAPPAQQTYAQPAAQPQQNFVQAVQQPVAQPAVSQPAYVAQQPAQQYAPATVYPQYAPAQGNVPSRQGVASIVYPAAGQTAAPAQQPPQQYGSPYSPPRVAMAYQTPASAGADNLSLTAPAAESVPPGAIQNGNGAYPPQPIASGEYAPAQGYPAQGYPAQGHAAPNGAAPGADCNCQPGGYESYPADGAAAAYGSCNTYSTYGEEPGMMSRVLGKGGGGYWFGGVYGLVMDRDSGDKYPFAYAASGMAVGDYPMPGDVVMNSRDVDTDFQGGIEFRLGRTFGSNVDPCGGCSVGPKWGVEGVYWTLFDNDEYSQYVFNGTDRTYSMMPMRGLQFDPGAGPMPVNEFWDYGTPVETGSIIVTMTKARSSFEVQNFELNLLRLGVCGNACGGPAMCNVGCDTGGCDTASCDSGSCDTCATGYACAPASRFSCTGVCGFRYLDFDESFMYGVNYYNTGNAASGYLDYWANTENKLIGAQLGCNGMYRIGCKWGLHMNTLVGVYGNDIDVEQYFYSSGGQVTYAGSGENFDVNASKTDVAMLGEVRVGASYQATCRCRLYGGWRAMGISGLALAADQTPNAFLNSAQMSDYVNSNGSMILHGLQTGVEWNY
ncbi:MAG: hypothetical protein H0T51_17790 [Pirellulales bacterium]|nr:hypothetical protein [Pirellulales bacterium]